MPGDDAPLQDLDDAELTALEEFGVGQSVAAGEYLYHVIEDAHTDEAFK